eukprot:248324_1
MPKRKSKGKNKHKNKRKSKQQTQSVKQPSNNNNQESIFSLKNININDSYVKRINFLLNIYEKFIENHGKYDKYTDIKQMICAHYPASKINFFMADYNKYVNNIDNNNIYKRNDGKCDLVQCSHIQREYRNQNIYDSNSDLRTKLYHNCKSEQSVVFCQFLDALHVVKYHLVDLGLRHIPTHNASTDLTEQRKLINKRRADLNINKVHSKFVTEIFNKESEEKNDDCTQDTKMHHYSFGYRFYYHNYYQNNTQRDGAIPGTNGGMFDYGHSMSNPCYTFGDWYITPKYKSMKIEILNSNSKKLSMIQYENTLTKAVLKYNAFKRNIDGAVFYWRIVYGIQDHAPITILHIFSVLVYTNHTELSAEFTKTFRKLSDTETDDSLKKRHAEYANWGRLLRETVECWGTSLQDASSMKYFYHGISCHMLFDGFNQKFCGPTSTTLQKTVAITFASQGNDNKGIVITIRNDGMANWFWNCVSWSDYPGEMEMLFIGGWQELEICGLIDIDNSMNYDKWIESMQIFQKGLIQCMPSNTIQPSNNHEKMIGLMIHDVLTDDNMDNQSKDVPMYVHQLFNQLLTKTISIEIDIGCLNTNVCFIDEFGDVMYGYKLLYHIYFTPNNNIKWNVLRMLFPSVHVIYIRYAKRSKYMKSNYVKSIEISNESLKTLLSYLSSPNNTWKCINIHYPSNTMKSLESLIENHQLSYNRHGFKIGIKKIKHQQFGSCHSFFIHM